MLLPSTLLAILQFPFSPTVQPDKCTSLTSIVSIPGTVVMSAARHPTGSYAVPNDPLCPSFPGPPLENGAAICRVTGVIMTSPTSSVDFEMWLPDTWHGRFLVTGNGGLGGCVDYANLDHGSYLHFATIGTNNGHDGYLNEKAFLMPKMKETVEDFSHRAVHVAAKVGKEITTAYYGSNPHHSYYDGCSAGGRQGISVASRYPKDFDGVIAGAPGIDWHGLLASASIWASHVAANTSSHIKTDLWTDVVGPEILRQCDRLDGQEDKIIADPEDCEWNPTTLLCKDEDVLDPTTCLTQPQVDGLKKFYEPIRDSRGRTLYSRFDPGAECDMETGHGMGTGGVISVLTEAWYKYAIYGDPGRSLDDFSVADLERANELDPVGISTWRNALQGLAKFKDEGGKLITFHGTRDPMIPSGQSKRFYRLLAYFFTAPDERPENGYDKMDEFYRLFMVPGMGHCLGGPGAWKIGQGAIVGRGTDGANQTDRSVMLSIVDWVEGGHPPKVIVGTNDHGVERRHCMWPRSKSVWKGGKWVCHKPGRKFEDLDDGFGDT